MKSAVRNRALIPVLSIMLPVYFTGCNSSEYDQAYKETQKLEAKVEELQDQNKALRYQFSDMNYALHTMSRLQKQETQLLSEVRAINEYKQNLETALQQVEFQLDPWKEETRRNLIGKSIGPVQSRDGRTLANPRIKEVTDDTVVLTHEGGEDVFAITDLPKDIRLLLVHEPTVTFESKSFEPTHIR